MAEITSREYRALAEFRYRIRCFLAFSEAAAKVAGVEPQQHQLLLAVKAAEPEEASIGYLAERLRLQHHSVVGLVDRLEQAGLVRRVRAQQDRRTAHVQMTAKGAKILRALSLHHRRELRSTIPSLIASLEHIMGEVPRAHHAAPGHNRKPKHA